MEGAANNLHLDEKLCSTGPIISAWLAQSLLQADSVEKSMRSRILTR